MLHANTTLDPRAAARDLADRTRAAIVSAMPAASPRSPSSPRRLNSAPSFSWGRSRLQSMIASRKP